MLSIYLGGILGTVSQSILAATMLPDTTVLTAPSPFRLTEVSVKYQQLLPGAVDPMITYGPVSQRLDKELNLVVNSEVLKYGYWDNTVHSETDQSQFRKIGWELQLGVHATRFLDVFYEHYSQHLLDYSSKEAFPRQDGVGIKLYLYRGDN